MKRRKSELAVFGVAFLDVLSCLLGGLLLIVFIVINESHQKEENAKNEIADLSSQLSAAHHVIDESEKANDELTMQLTDSKRNYSNALDNVRDLEGQISAAQRKIEQLNRIGVELVGFRGDFKGVVFIFDSSGSMQGPDFSGYKNLVCTWIESLHFEAFNVIHYSDANHAWHASSLAPDNPANKSSAASFVKSIVADGGTNTWAALDLALSIPQVDTIILISDGQPTDAPPGHTSGNNAEAILNWLKKRNPNSKVAINTVAVGDYWGQFGSGDSLAYGEFLARMARENGGRFVGMGD